MEKKKKKRKKNHHRGNPMGVALVQNLDDIGAALKDHLPHLMPLVMSHQQQENDLLITESHKNEVVSSFREEFYKKQLFEDVLEESVVMSKAGTKMLKYIMNPEQAAYIVGGLALGFSFADAQHIMTAIWEYIRDWNRGKRADPVALKQYAAEVRKHVGKRTRIMIFDLKKAIEEEKWIKVNRIQNELRGYGKKTGYMYEEAPQLDELNTRTLARYILKARVDGDTRSSAGKKLIKQGRDGSMIAADQAVNVTKKLPLRAKGIDRAMATLKRRGIIEDGGGAAGGFAAPTNSVGTGHIAGANGDPPGGKNRMRRIILRRMKGQ